MGTIRGAGSLRQRRPGVWEVRVALGPDPVTGRSRVRSITVHGDRDAAQSARQHWAATAELLRGAGRPRPAITVAQLLHSWLTADHDWKPSTVSGYRSNVGFLCRDPVGSRRAIDLTPTVLTAICRHWLDIGWHQPTVSNRFRVLRSAMGWAYTMRILDRHPLDGVQGPPRCGTRKDVPLDQVRDLLVRTQGQADQLNATRARGCHEAARRHRAEQLQLLTRLVADSGARRAELAALRFDDLDGSVLTITRATSNEILGTTKGGRTRRITLGPTTIGLWTDLSNRWRGRCPAGARFGPWVLSRDPAHTTRLTTSTLGHWFTAACDRAGHPDITLHRLRHTVATALGQGQVLQAQYRLGHRDASTTLRVYTPSQPPTPKPPPPSRTCWRLGKSCRRRPTSIRHYPDRAVPHGSR